MIVRPIVSVGSVPTASMLLGTRGNQEIINSINQRWQNTGVIFGSATDPFADRFKSFTEAVVNVARDTANLLERAYSFIMEKNQVVPIQQMNDLAAVPACMHRPILSHPTIHKLLDDGKIYGWGIDPETMPEEDEWGRIINNGYIGPDPLTGIMPEEYEWHWKSTDPDIDPDDLSMLMDARQFIDSFILEQMDGDLIDPTDFLSGGKLCTIR